MDGITEANRKLLFAATSSTERFGILDLAVRPATFSVTEAARTIDRSWGTAQGHVNGLVTAGLVDDANAPAYAATADGHRAHACVVGGASDVMMFRRLVGHRLLAVSLEGRTDPRRILRLMQANAIAVALTDDDYDLVGFYPDDSAMVKNLRSRVRRNGAERVTLSRVAEVVGLQRTR